MSAVSLRAQALAALLAPDPEDKCLRVLALRDASVSGELAWSHPEPAVDIPNPGRPPRPRLVRPRDLERRSLGTVRGRAALLHAVAHIEFNAINLALDAAYRFGGLPAEYYQDWISVAVDEARHFEMLTRRLAELGHGYGDFPAHNGLWEMAQQTAHCGMTRMALVPRVLEARGLDVSPGMIQRLEGAGDRDSAAILRVILDEEVRHVEIGTRWYHHWCRQHDVDPLKTFQDLLAEHADGAIRGPFNFEARRQAGFDGAEMALLLDMDRNRD